MFRFARRASGLAALRKNAGRVGGGTRSRGYRRDSSGEGPPETATPSERQIQGTLAEAEGQEEGCGPVRSRARGTWRRRSSEQRLREGGASEGPFTGCFVLHALVFCGGALCAGWGRRSVSDILNLPGNSQMEMS